MRMSSIVQLTSIPNTIPDGELLQRLVSRRDDLSFRMIVHRHGSLVWSVCRRSLQDMSGPSVAAKPRLVNTPELKEQRNATVLYVFGL